MNLKLKALTEKVKPVQLTNGVAYFEMADIFIGADASNKKVYTYDTGYEVNIPEGFIGVVSPTDGICLKSLQATTDFNILTPGNQRVICRFKINTDAIPTIFMEGDHFAQLVIMPCDSLSTMDIEEYVQVAEDLTTEAAE